MKSLLMVVGNFPPEQDSASVAAGKLAEALVRSGWRVIVVAREKSGARSREMWLQSLPDAIYTFRGWGYADYPRWLRPLLKGGCGFTLYRESSLYFSHMRKAVTEVLRKHSVDLVLGVVGPTAIIGVVSTVPAGSARRALWYIDPASYSPAPFYRRWLTQSVLQKHEGALISRMDYLFFHSPELMEAYARAQPQLRTRMHLLYPGFDVQEIRIAGAETPPREGILIGYFGNVRTGEARALKMLMSAIQMMPETRQRQFGFYVRGEIGKKQRRMLARHIDTPERKFQWEENAQRVRLGEILKEIQRCDFLATSRMPSLLLNPSGKIFWYLGLRKPIIYMGDPGTAEATLVRRSGAGIVFTFRTPMREIRDFLAHALVAKEKGESIARWNEDFLAALDLRKIVEEFTRIVSVS